ncbi:MAG: TlpA disulfide reductase family protein [Chitinophagales bacterium]
MSYIIKLKNYFFYSTLCFSMFFFSQNANSQEIVEAIHLDENAGGLQVGDRVPNLVLQNRYNTTSNLYAMGNKYVYLHYWASWCPCSQPHITNYKLLYDKYQNANFVDANGFEIYSVSIDEKEANWNEAVEDYNMVWKNNARIQDEYGENELMMWDLRTVPTAYLIDPRGVVIAKNPSLIEMDAILSERSDMPGPRKLGRTVVLNPSEGLAPDQNFEANQDWNNNMYNTWNSNTSSSASLETYTTSTEKPADFMTYNQFDYSNPNYSNSMVSSQSSNNMYAANANTMNTNTNTQVIDGASIRELKVNVGDFYMLTQDHVDVIKDLGQLQVNNQSNGSQTVIIKNLANHDAAYNVLLEIHKRGFTDAFLMY